MLILNRESLMYFRKVKAQFNDTCDQRKNLSVCQEAEKGGNGSPINSCNFQKHLACMLEFFLLCPTMEDKHPLLFHM